MIRFFFILLVSTFFLIGCAASENSEQPITPSEIEEEKPTDAHSFSNINDVRTKHLTLNLKADFEKQVLSGSVTHQIENLNQAKEFIVDVSDLKIEQVKNGEGQPLNWTLGDVDSIKGRPLIIQITDVDSVVTIAYRTSRKSKALQWLTPQQTAGKKFPYLFTQGQAILTRSWIPCQDSPMNRITYDATIEVPANLMAVMSASNVTSKNETGKYEFTMDKKIPAYLIALAVGDIAFQALSDRTGVYAEKEMLSRSANEFVDVEKMILTAEELYGPYQWGRYDMIVLPPSFPFGGMENPKLTFATPTIIAGDRSLVSLIAHELAHSWSGNLVTNATWDDFWLNEGFTVYFENRIMEALYGLDYADMLFYIEYDELLRETEEISKSQHPEDTQLKLNLTGRDPDDGMTSIAYVKGALFLKTVENAVGREAFDKFVHAYFDNFAFQTLTTEQFVDYLDKELLTPNKVDFNTKEWIYQQGIPSNAIKVKSSRFEVVELVAAKIPTMKSVEELTIDKDNWSTQEWIQFIRSIPNNTNVSQFEELESAFGFSTCGNAEIMAEWYIQSIKHDYHGGYEAMEGFLIEVGRRKFLEPIYEALAKTTENKAFAMKVYEKARPNYHSISRGTIDEILNWQKK